MFDRMFLVWLHAPGEAICSLHPYRFSAPPRCKENRQQDVLRGNLLRQPVFVQLRKDRPDSFRVVSATGKALTASELELQLSASTAANGAASPLPGADEIMKQAIFLGTYPGLTKEMMDYEIEVIREFVQSFRK